MRTLHFRGTRACARVALVTALSLAWSPVAPLVHAQTTKTATAKPAAAQAAAAEVPPDGGWPKAFTTNAGAALVLYQPQVANWANQRHAVLYSAVSYTPRGARAPSNPSSGVHRARAGMQTSTGSGSGKVRALALGLKGYAGEGGKRVLPPPLGGPVSSNPGKP